MDITRRDFARRLLTQGAATRVVAAGLVATGSIAARRSLAAAEEPREWKPSRKYRAAVIGHTGRGGYGHGLDVCFQRIPEISVVAVADPDGKAREATARKNGGAKPYADWEEMLRVEKPDLVAIGPRWVEGRLEMVRAAAAAGAHVYLEKPLARSLEEADAILAAAAKGGIQLQLAFHSRLAPSVLHLRSLVAGGLLGDLLEVRTRGKEDHRSGGEDLMVLGTHCLYLLRLFAGRPLWCSALVLEKGRGITRADAREATEPLGPVAGDSIQASYAFPGGVQGHFASQRLAVGPGGRFECRLFGSKGEAVIHIGMDPEVFHLPDPLWSPGKSGARWGPLPGAPPNRDAATGLEGQDAANRRLVLDLLRAAEKGEAPAASGEEGRAVLEMILAVYASHLSGARVEFPLNDRRHPLSASGAGKGK